MALINVLFNTYEVPIYSFPTGPVGPSARPSARPQRALYAPVGNAFAVLIFPPVFMTDLMTSFFKDGVERLSEPRHCPSLSCE